MSTTEFAREELRRAGLFDKDSDYGGMMGDAVMDLVELFAAQDHSGFSASMAIQLFSLVASHKPLTPLTGDNDEWNEVGDNTWQNRRCPTVFKTAEGAYNIDGRVFIDEHGAAYTNRESRVPVEFPYVPTTEYIHR